MKLEIQVLAWDKMCLYTTNTTTMWFSSWLGTDTKMCLYHQHDNNVVQFLAWDTHQNVSIPPTRQQCRSVPGLGQAPKCVYTTNTTTMSFSSWLETGAKMCLYHQHDNNVIQFLAWDRCQNVSIPPTRQQCRSVPGLRQAPKCAYTTNTTTMLFSSWLGTGAKMCLYHQHDNNVVQFLAWDRCQNVSIPPTRQQCCSVPGLGQVPKCVYTTNTTTMSFSSWLGTGAKMCLYHQHDNNVDQFLAWDRCQNVSIPPTRQQCRSVPGLGQAPTCVYTTNTTTMSFSSWLGTGAKMCLYHQHDNNVIQFLA